MLDFRSVIAMHTYIIAPPHPICGKAVSDWCLFLLYSGVFCCMFFEALLYSGGGDGCVKVWDIGTGQEVMSLDGDNEEVVCR